MAHEIDTSTGRAAMAYVGATPWHGLGQRLEQGASIDEWLAAAGMNFTVERSPVMFAHGMLKMDITTWGEKHVLYRDDTLAPLGVVSDSYQIVQPAQVLEFFRDLTAEAGFTLETAGVLFGGRRYWALARVTADTAIRDRADLVGGYVLLSTSADGTLSTTGRLTTIRVVCNNTLALATADRAGTRAEFRLTHGAEFDASAAKAEIGIARASALRETFAATMDMLRALAAKPITSLDIADATLRLFVRDRTTMTEKELDKAARSKPVSTIGQMAATGVGLMGADLDGTLGTAWGWLNAVTQYVDHSARAGTQDLRLNSAWFGAGDLLKRKALAIAQEMADGSIQFVEREQTDTEHHADVLGHVLAATAGGGRW